MKLSAAGLILCFIFSRQCLNADPAVFQPQKQILAHEGGVRKIVIGNSNRVLTLGNDDFARLWNTSSFEEALAMPSKPQGADLGYDSSSQRFYWIATDPLYLFELRTVPNVFGTGAQLFDVGQPSCSTLDAQHKIAILADGATTSFIDLEAKTIIAAIDSGSTFGGVYICPSGAQYAVSREIQKPSSQNPYYIWNIELRTIPDGTLIRTFYGHQNKINDIVFSSSGSTMFSSSGMYRKIEIVSGRTQFINEPQTPDAAVHVWDVNTGAQLNQVGLPNPVEFLDISSDGRFLAATVNKEVFVIETNSLVPVALLQGLSYRLSAVAFSPDGNEIVAGSFDGKMAIWDVSAIHN